MTKEARDQARAEAANIAQRVENGKLNELRGLRACRERAGLSQKAAAPACRVVHQTFCAWETGRNWPNAYHLPIIAAALGCSIEELYLGPDQDGKGGAP